VNRQDLLQSSSLFRGIHTMDNDPFTLEYSIPRRISDRVRIEDVVDFEQMVDEATKKAAAEVKFFVIEQVWSPVSSFIFLTLLQLFQMVVDDNGDNELESDDGESGPTRKKKKVGDYMRLSPSFTTITKVGPSREEVEQSRIIAELEQRYHCEDRSCSKSTCYLAGPRAQHVHLTFQHLRTWAAAIVGLFLCYPLYIAHNVLLARKN
jgi:hypothetical protein